MRLTAVLILALSVVASVCTGLARSDLQVRRNADVVSFVKGGVTNTITFTADYIVGTLTLRGDSDPGLDIATMSTPWEETLEEITRGLAIVVSVSTNVQYESDTTKSHYITVVYRVLPRDGEALYYQLLLSDDGRLNAIVWNVFLSKCSAICDGASTDWTAWAVDSDSDANGHTGLVFAPWTFYVGSTTTIQGTTTTTRSDITGNTGNTGGSGSGSTSGSDDSTTAGGVAKTWTTTKASVTTAVACERPTVVGFALSDTHKAAFTFCKAIAYRAAQQFTFVIIDDDDRETKQYIALNRADVISSVTVEVDISSYRTPGIFFRLVMPDGAVSGSDGTESLEYISPVYAVPAAAAAAAEEKDTIWKVFGTLWLRAILISAAATVFLFLGSVCLWRWYYGARPLSDEPARGRNMMYLRSPSMMLKWSKTSKVQPLPEPVSTQDATILKIAKAVNLEANREANSRNSSKVSTQSPNSFRSPRTGSKQPSWQNSPRSLISEISIVEGRAPGHEGFDGYRNPSPRPSQQRLSPRPSPRLSPRPNEVPASQSQLRRPSMQESYSPRSVASNISSVRLS